MRFTAVVLAGSRRGELDEVAVAGGVACKALAPVAGVSMLERVVRALQTSDLVDDILVSISSEICLDREVPNLDIRQVAPDVTPVVSVQKVLDVVKDDVPVLLTTADHALLTSEMIQSFISGFDGERFEAAAAMLPLDILTRTYPQMRRTRLRFRGGGYKSCNLFIFSSRKAAYRVMNLWKQIEGERKRPWRLAFHLGPDILVKYFLGQLSLDDAFNRLSQLSNTRVQPVKMSIPEAAIDVDTVENYDFVRKFANS